MTREDSELAIALFLVCPRGCDRWVVGPHLRVFFSVFVGMFSHEGFHFVGAIRGGMSKGQLLCLRGKGTKTAFSR